MRRVIESEWHHSEENPTQEYEANLLDVGVGVEEDAHADKMVVVAKHRAWRPSFFRVPAQPSQYEIMSDGAVNRKGNLWRIRSNVT